MDSQACPYCQQEGQVVSLVFDPEALMMVCPSCGSVDPDASSQGYETLGRATEDESHLLGRALVNAQGRVVGAGQRGRLAAQAASQARQDNAGADLELFIESVGCRRVIESIAEYCSLVFQRDNIDRATAIYKAAVIKYKLQVFNVKARAWAAASVWLAADECNLSTSTGELLTHFRVRFPRVRRCKIQLSQFSTVHWSSDTSVRIHHDLLDMILDKLVELTNVSKPVASTSKHPVVTLHKDSDTEEEEETSGVLPNLADKNKPFVKQVTAQAPKIRRLVITLASRFVGRQVPDITRDAIFTCCCVLVASEAVMRKRVPLLGNLISILAPTVCFGAAANTVNHKYRLMVRWLQATFLELPWIPDEQKRPFDGVDLAQEAGEDSKAEMLRNIKSIRGGGKAELHRKHPDDGRSVGTKSGTRKTGDLARFFQEIIEYDPAVFGRSSLPLDIDEEEEAEVKEAQARLADLRQFDWMPPQGLRQGIVLDPHQVKRRKIVTQAEEALVRLQQEKPSASIGTANEHLHHSNIQHYLRLLLSGEDADQLSVSQELLHLPVAPLSTRAPAVTTYQQTIARLLRERQCTVDDLDVDEDLFMPGEMDSYLRQPDEVAQARQLAVASGLFAKHDERQAAARAQSELQEHRDKRSKLRQAEKDRLAFITAAPKRIRQKRKRGSDSEDGDEAQDDKVARIDSPAIEDEIRDVSAADFDAVVASLSGVPSAAKYILHGEERTDSQGNSDLFDLEIPDW